MDKQHELSLRLVIRAPPQTLLTPDCLLTSPVQITADTDTWLVSRNALLWDVFRQLGKRRLSLAAGCRSWRELPPWDRHGSGRDPSPPPSRGDGCPTAGRASPEMKGSCLSSAEKIKDTRTRKVKLHSFSKMGGSLTT